MYEVTLTVVPWDDPEDSISDVQTGEHLDEIDTYGKPIAEAVGMFQEQLPRCSNFEALRVVKENGELVEMETVSFSTGKTAESPIESSALQGILSAFEVIGKAAMAFTKVN